jgi:hypothetical protein
MTSLEPIASHSQTLAHRLSEGGMPVPEALSYAILLGEALRRIHGGGQVHGAVSPESILLTEAGIDLTPATAATDVVTPYSAPEQLKGQPASIPSDIFSFGALLYEMVTGCRAFTGETEADLAAAIATAVPVPTGIPALDRLIGGCLVKDPNARLQSIQKVLLELKLLRAAARRAEGAGATRREALEARLSAQMQDFEARVAARMEEREKSAAAIEQASSEALDALRTELAATQTELAAAQGRLAAMQDNMEAAGQRLSGQVQQSMEASAAVEQSIDCVRQHSTALETRVDGDFGNYQKKFETQTAAIESVRASLAETDCLVERLVEAMEMLQGLVLGSSDAL